MTVETKSSDYLVHVSGHHGQMAEPSMWLLITVVYGECGVVLGAVVMGQLEHNA